MGLFLDFSSVPLVYIFSLMPLLHYFDYWSFVVSFEIGDCESSSVFLLFFFFQDYFGCQGPHCNSKWILRLAFSFLQKYCSNFDKDCIESTGLLGNIAILTVLSFFSIHDDGMSIYAMFNFFQLCFVIYCV